MSNTTKDNIEENVNLYKPAANFCINTLLPLLKKYRVKVNKAFSPLIARSLIEWQEAGFLKKKQVYEISDCLFIALESSDWLYGKWIEEYAYLLMAQSFYDNLRIPKQISSELISIVKEACLSSTADQYRKGNEKAINALVGMVMKQCKYDAAVIKQLILEELNERS